MCNSFSINNDSRVLVERMAMLCLEIRGGLGFKTNLGIL